MAKDLVVEAAPREELGKSAVRRVRDQGRLPGVIYGKDVCLNLTVDRHDFLRVLHAHGAHPIVTVKLDGSEYLALVKELQVDPVKRQALHIDFQRVEENVAVQTDVAIAVVGEPAGVKEGGILQIQLTMLLIEALRRHIPEVVEFDASDLGMNDVARVGDIVPPEGVRIITDPEETLASVVAPAAEVAAAAVAEGEEVAAEGEAPAGEAPAEPAEGAEGGES
jgi:large subunit ribosomal protein L25